MKSVIDKFQYINSISFNVRSQFDEEPWVKTYDNLVTEVWRKVDDQYHSKIYGTVLEKIRFHEISKT